MTNLSALSYPNGTLAIAAFDHRNSLSELLNPSDPSTVTGDQIVNLKRLFIEAFADISSAILIDPVYGLDYSLDLTASLPKKCGLLLSLEESSYDESQAGRMTRLLPHWGVADIKAYGAAAKLLLYYHPEAPIAAKQLELVKQLSQECRDKQVIFLIEPIMYGIGEYSKASKTEATLTTIRQLNPLVDILKLEFPLDPKQTTSAKWHYTADAISAAATVPWILLSRGMPYDPFKDLTGICCEAGASGIAVGRAVWQEIEQISARNQDFPDLLMPHIEEFLLTTARLRMRELIEIVGSTAKPWNQI
jgi:tagatose 1,6-diphosphate aldolase